MDDEILCLSGMMGIKQAVTEFGSVTSPFINFEVRIH